VSEFVHRPTLKRSIKAKRERQAGREPKQPEAYFLWDRDSLLCALKERIACKDKKKQKGGPYERYALVAHTDEWFLDRDRTSLFLRKAVFHTKLITDVFLGLSYKDGCTPVFHFAASPRAADDTWTLQLQPSLFVPRYDVFPFAGTMAEEFPSRESMIQLILKRASASRPAGEWNDDDYDVLADGAVVGRIFKANGAPVGAPWMWTFAFGQHEDRTPTHGYKATREAAMTAFAKSWRRK
jgi:hypothetical protein